MFPEIQIRGSEIVFEILFIDLYIREDHSRSVDGFLAECIIYVIECTVEFHGVAVFKRLSDGCFIGRGSTDDISLLILIEEKEVIIVIVLDGIQERNITGNRYFDICFSFIGLQVLKVGKLRNRTAALFQGDRTTYKEPDDPYERFFEAA